MNFLIQYQEVRTVGWGDGDGSKFCVSEVWVTEEI